MKTFNPFLIIIAACLSISLIYEPVLAADVFQFNQNIKSSKLNEMLISTSKQMNKQLPIMIDDETRLDLTMAVDNSFLGKYTLINYKIDDIEINEFLSEVKPKIIGNLCSTTGTRSLLDEGVNYVYIYSDRNGELVSSFKIHLKDCK